MLSGELQPSITFPTGILAPPLEGGVHAMGDLFARTDLIITDPGLSVYRHGLRQSAEGVNDIS